MRKAIRALILWAVPELKQQGTSIYIVGDPSDTDSPRQRQARAELAARIARGVN